jgi:hypothetical protein
VTTTHRRASYIFPCPWAFQRSAPRLMRVPTTYRTSGALPVLSKRTGTLQMGTYADKPNLSVSLNHLSIIGAWGKPSESGPSLLVLGTVPYGMIFWSPATLFVLSVLHAQMTSMDSLGYAERVTLLRIWLHPCSCTILTADSQQGILVVVLGPSSRPVYPESLSQRPITKC